ncbi:hypothetical protein [Marinobacter fonticola]|uniref:hypothetical protein n=1 Tax=Marinobacter fonticola TaxID=2603215 RepID=UPI0011E67FC7|nr:hypothetical protein [Marinobacter fonticola]
MDDPKTVVKNEPRKSLIILFAAAIFTIIIGVIVLFAPGSGETDMAENVGWIMIAIGVACLGLYVYGRKERPKAPPK